jgi:hypothetical protein
MTILLLVITRPEGKSSLIFKSLLVDLLVPVVGASILANEVTLSKIKPAKIREHNQLFKL